MANYKFIAWNSSELNKILGNEHIICAILRIYIFCKKLPKTLGSEFGELAKAGNLYSRAHSVETI